MALLKLVLLAICLVLALALIAPLVLIYAGVQPAPLVQRSASAGQDDVGRIKALLRRHDPRDLRDGETRTLTVSERDLNLALQSGMPLADRLSTRATLAAGRGTLDSTVRLPDNPLGGYFNLSVVINEMAGELAVERIEAGDLTLPGWLLNPLLGLVDLSLRFRIPEYGSARDALQRVVLGQGEARVTYRWDRALAKRIEQRGREVLLPAADRERALAYYGVLAESSMRAGRQASLALLLRPLFAEAGRRSEDGDAAAENRVLLLVLGTVLNRSSMHRLVGGESADLSPGHRYVRWTLQGRGDLAQHFGISAAIAAAGGGLLADSIGVFKELDDSRGGSGFSFADLLADRAGVELAGAAMGDRAAELQGGMAAENLRETDFMPPVDRLPEGLMEMAFRQRYRDLDDARYGRIKGEIDSRIANLTIHR